MLALRLFLKVSSYPHSEKVADPCHTGCQVKVAFISVTPDGTSQPPGIWTNTTEQSSIIRVAAARRLSSWNVVATVLGGSVLIALKTLGIFTKTIHAVLWSTVHWAVSPCHKNTLFSTTQPCYEYVSQHDLCLVLTTKWWHVKRVNERMRGSKAFMYSSILAYVQNLKY